KYLYKNVDGLENPREKGKGLTANRVGQWRYRIGEYRVICQINDNEYRYVERVFEFDNKIAKEVMTPRTEVEAIDLEDSLAVISRQMKQEEY
ncbi:type II toxin-antitoxin system RelE/ParE family toxin, partial [Streptococcus danieliae]|nr:type II toxin-antitoxin system RelE/ParE family toxin [Streptococcus danieliae]